MVRRRDVSSIEPEIGRTFEQMIPFNRVLGLKIDSLDPRRRGCGLKCDLSWSATRFVKSCTAG